MVGSAGPTITILLQVFLLPEQQDCYKKPDIDFANFQQATFLARVLLDFCETAWYTLSVPGREHFQGTTLAQGAGFAWNPERRLYADEETDTPLRDGVPD
uniref:Uncharacterized protein n=1 Tax=Thermogemmatispora argillosa TaxID=2045280 RepID=A0A455T7X9_9CHLR|nr:hypothetical protein KTA_37440 [Thermogemmatispora argillosa]